MANRKARQGSSSQSIVRHPLFPTIVAFWFAALFGLGSLAVRTSLLESVVIASRIDLIVPQTAPPLGITARILIALAMAAIGSILGFFLALRLARPRPEPKQERVRTFGSSGRLSTASPGDMPQDGQEDRAGEPDRRRALIASNASLDNSVFDDGPSFMTGMAPHILDVTEFDVDPLDRPTAVQEQSEQAPPALELDQYATDAPVPAPGFETVAAPYAADETGPLPEAEAALPAGAIEYLQPMPAQPVAEQSEAAPAARQAFSAPAGQGSRSFDAPFPPVDDRQPPEAPLPEIAMEAQEEPLLQAYVAPVTSPLQFSVGGTEAAVAAAPERPFDALAPAQPDSPQEIPAVVPETDDADPLAAFRNKAAPMPVFDDAPEPYAAPEPAEYGIHEALAADPEPAETAIHAEPEPAPEPEAELLSLSSQLVPPLGSAAEHLLKADLADLSPVELIERLALSLQRRGKPVALSRVLASQPAPLASFAAEPEPEAPADETPAVAAEPADNRGFALPAAMRPIDFSQYEHDDALPDYVPGRSIAMPARETREEPAPIEQQDQPAAQFDAPQEGRAMPRFGRPAQGDEPSVPTEDDVLEAGYSSLLDMSRPAGQRPQFVRVIDPEAETEAPEPVVIFSGQAMRAGTRFAAPAEGPLVSPAAPPPSLGEMSAQQRRFDAPPAQPQTAAAINPEETERALRSALSTLQRMSGAA